MLCNGLFVCRHLKIAKSLEPCQADIDQQDLFRLHRARLKNETNK